MYTRILKSPLKIGQSFFLFGPRGTGKTTWIKEHFSSGACVFIDLLNGDMYTELLARPHRLDTMIGTGSPSWIIIDEIQRVPELLNEVHRLIESRGLRFAMTGSSARSLRRRGVNLLAGRALSFQMHPLTASELGGDFNLEQSLRHGHLPAIFGHSAPSEFLASYVQSYLREEVQQEGLTRNLGNFTRFLETASFSQGASLNVSHVARESALDRKVVESYFGILDDLLIGYRLPAFSKRARRRLVTHPKFYFFDAGVYRTIRPMGPLDSPAEADGAGLETLLLQELRATNDALGFDYDLFYWRTSDGTVVDFVLYGTRGVLAFEIKRSDRYTRSDLTGLRAFRKDYPMSHGYLLYGGNQVRYEDGIQILPTAQALQQLSSLMGAPGVRL